VAAVGYEIRAKGRLSDTVASAFEDFTASVKPAETTLAETFVIRLNSTGCSTSFRRLASS
jgi:hypothetical protein